MSGVLSILKLLKTKINFKNYMSQAVQHEVQAARNGVAVCDRSDWGRILVSNADRLRFLHNQSTNSFSLRQPGEGCDTVFVNSVGRTIDLVTAYVMDDAVLLLVSPQRRQAIVPWMDRFIFFADKVTLEDVTDSTGTLTLVGPDSDRLIEKLGAADLVGQPYGTHRTFTIDGIGDGESVRIAVGSGLAIAGYTLFTSREAIAPLQASLVTWGAVPLNEAGWEQLRVEQGRPTADQELSEEVNPLEAGLWHTISLSKGCYIGQETIARLHTYKGVKQQLWGVKLATLVEPGSTVLSGEDKVGKLTSCIPTAEGAIGLAYIRTKSVEAGVQTVQIAGTAGVLVPLPFVSHEYI